VVGQKGVSYVLDRLIDGLVALACLIVVFDAILITVETLIRFFFGLASSELFEITEFTMLWMTFLGAGWVMKRNMHVRVDILTNRLKGTSRASLLAASYLFASAILLLMTYYTFKLTFEDLRAGITVAGVLRPKKWYIEAIVPIGFFLLFLKSLGSTWEVFRNFRRLA